MYGSLTVTAGEDLPSIGELRASNAFKSLIEGVQAVDGLRDNKKEPTRDIEGEVDEWQRTGFKGLAGAGTMLSTFQLFHTPLAKQRSESYTPEDERNKVTWRTHERATIKADDFVSSLDFHRIVSAMNQYPLLLRRLGLVVDFTVPVGRLRAGDDIPVSFAVELPRARAGEPVVVRRDASPRTRTKFASKELRACAAAARGWERPAGARWAAAHGSEPGGAAAGRCGWCRPQVDELCPFLGRTRTGSSARGSGDQTAPTGRSACRSQWWVDAGAPRQRRQLDQDLRPQ